MADPAVKPSAGPDSSSGFVRGLGLWDSTMVVAGAMIGSGIFIVSADIARLTGSGGWLLLVWLFTGLLTIAGALTYGELAGMMPRAGGQYVFLRESYSPLFGFLYGWTLFLVIQTGTIAAVAVAFARFLGVLVPSVSPTAWIIPPVNVSSGYAVSLSWQQLVAILSIVILTLINLNGLRLGKLIQNTFTGAKILTLLAVVVLGILVGRNAAAAENFRDLWTIRDPQPIVSDLGFPTVTAAQGLLGLIVAFCVAQVGSLFSADAWHNIAFTAGEVKNPKRDIPLSLLFGTGIVITLYLLANVAYLSTLPLDAIKHAPDDRVGTALLNVIFGSAGAGIMAFAILISTFGCNNGLILAGARVYYAMAKDKLFFGQAGTLNRNHVPGMSLILQSAWACFLVLPRTRLRDASGAELLDASDAAQYGNLYGNLLDYVVFSVLIFYILTVAAVFVMRRKRPDAERPYRAFGYPFVPALYIAGAATIVIVLLLYRTQTTWPGLLIVLTGIPVYFLWQRRAPG